MKYRTIVADPPWPPSHRTGAFGRRGEPGLHYDVMNVAAIADLPIREMAEDSSHLYLWVMNSNVPDGWRIAQEWGFRPLTMLTWCKPGPGIGTWFRNNTEHVLFCSQGQPLKRRVVPNSTWFQWPRGRHSEKPAAFFDLVERCSPGPYLELFARRQRLGWDTWGDEALEHVELSA